jgi:hypothetical protein
MKIDNIIGMHVYTDTGERLGVKEFINQPKVGYEVTNAPMGYRAIPSGEDSCSV